MLPYIESRLPVRLREALDPASARGSLELSRTLSVPCLNIVCDYLTAEEVERLVRLCKRISYLAFHSSSGSKPIWTQCYIRDHALEATQVNELLALQTRDPQYEQLNGAGEAQALRS